MPLRVGNARRSTRPGVFWLAAGAHLLGLLVLLGAASYLLTQ
jgi:hypothetical protein